MNEQDIDQHVDRRLAKMLRGMAGDCACAYAQSLRAYANGLEAEADRLAPKPQVASEGSASRFEGVKYVAHVNKPSVPIRLATRDEFIAQHQREPYVDDRILLQWAEEGRVCASHRPDLYTPWHPKVGEKVRLEKNPALVGTVISVNGGWQRVSYPSGNCDEHISALRPFSFAPPACQPEGREEAKPEKQEFKPGDVVVSGTDRLVRVAGQNAWQSVTGLIVGPVSLPLTLATDREIADYLRDHGEARFVAATVLRDHFRNQAAAKAEGQT